MAVTSPADTALSTGPAAAVTGERRGVLCELPRLLSEKPRLLIAGRRPLTLAWMSAGRRFASGDATFTASSETQLAMWGRDGGKVTDLMH